MKKILIMFVFIALLLFPIISAIQIDMKDNYKQGETIVATFSGNFLQPILEENIYFFRRGVAVPFDYNLMKIGQDYFIYTPTLGKASENYSLVISEAEYYIAGGKTTTDNIVRNFTISNDYADFTTSPGVEIINNSLKLNLENIKDDKLTIYFYENPTIQENTSQGFFSFFTGTNNEETLNGTSTTLSLGEKKEVTFELTNLTKGTLKKVQLRTENFTQDIFVYIDNPKYDLNESEYVEINDTNQTGTNQTNQTEDEIINNPLQTCEELNGTICKAGKETCENNTIEALDSDSCCNGTCKSKEKSSTGKIIGFSIVGFLILVYIWFYFKKFKKPKKKVDLLEVAEGRDKKRLERIQKRVLDKRKK